MTEVPLLVWIILWALIATIGHELTHYIFWVPIVAMSAQRGIQTSRGTSVMF